MLGMTAAVKELPRGEALLDHVGDHPHGERDHTAPTSERSRAATTAAKAAAISVAIPTVSQSVGRRHQHARQPGQHGAHRPDADCHPSRIRPDIDVMPRSPHSP